MVFHWLHLIVHLTYLRYIDPILGRLNCAVGDINFIWFKVRGINMHVLKHKQIPINQVIYVEWTQYQY